MLPALAAVAVVLMAESAAQAQRQYDPPLIVEGRGQAIEGDRLRIGGQTVRLYGLDAPDPGQTCRARDGREYDCAAASRNMLQRMMGEAILTCTIHAELLTGDVTGICVRDETKDIGAYMLAGGWAVSYRGLSDRYEYLEARARSNRAGLWSGRFERPRIWRARQR